MSIIFYNSHYVNENNVEMQMTIGDNTFLHDNYKFESSNVLEQNF